MARAKPGGRIMIVEIALDEELTFIPLSIGCVAHFPMELVCLKATNVDYVSTFVAPPHWVGQPDF